MRLDWLTVTARGARPCGAALAAGLLALAVAASAAGEGDAELTAEERAEARAPAERLHDALLDVMKRAEGLGFEGRVEALSPVVAEVYDVPFMAEKVLGAHWRKLTPEQRERWTAAFGRLTTATYADRFEGYSGERFEFLGVEPAGHGTRVVRTRLVPQDREPVELAYRVRPTDAGWRIVDVYLDGTVSELAMRRSEYASVVRREGFDALLAKVQERIDEAGKS